MLSETELKRVAKLVVDGMLIGRKRNEAGILYAKRFYPRIEQFLKANRGKVLTEKQLTVQGIGPKILEKLALPDCGPILSKRGNGYAVRDTIGESVRIRHHPDNWPLARQIILECNRRGAHAYWTSSDCNLSRELLEQSPVEGLEDFPALTLANMNALDVTIYIEDEDDPQWKKGLSPLKLAAGQANGQRAHEILDDRQVRWLVLGWPFEKTAREFGWSEKAFSSMLFSSLEESFSKHTRDTVAYYEKKFTGADKVQITHEDGTDLQLSVKGRPVLKDLGTLTWAGIEKDGDVGLNLPSGEAFISPLETSANGTITFPHVNVYGHGFTSGLTLRFKNGRVEEYWAEKGKVFLDAYLKENTPSTRTIAELGIGANKAAKWCGYLLTDEKIFGTIHIAIGNNTGSYHGKNKASGHLDMVKPMAKGLMTVDGKPVMVKGEPALSKG
jgi:leucyl aminopeptidase (aminopeptidase T)